MPSGIPWYKLEGHTPIRCKGEEWKKAAANPDDGRVARDEYDGVMVSTVFLSMDHRFGGGPPLLFETLVFGGPPTTS